MANVDPEIHKMLIAHFMDRTFGFDTRVEIKHFFMPDSFDVLEFHNASKGRMTVMLHNHEEIPETEMLDRCDDECEVWVPNS